ncbi:MAG: DUF3943 domain-containing protein [Bacteroidales bacterium]
MLIRTIAILLGLLPTVLQAQVIKQDSIDLVIENKAQKELKRDWGLYSDKTSPFDKRHPNRLLISSGTIVGASIVSFGILYLMPESFSNWNKAEMTVGSLTNDWLENVKTGPVIDKDDLFLNWVMHPYFGGIYYVTARSAGHKWYSSAMYSVIVSTFFWEYGIEAFAEVPSLQDLIITPVLGSVVGEAFYIAKKRIKRNNYNSLNSRVLGKLLLFLMDPLNEIQDGFVRRRARKGKKNSFQLHSSLRTDAITGQLTMNISLFF